MSSFQERTTPRREDERQALEEFMCLRSADSFCSLFAFLYPQVRRYFLARGINPMAAEELSQNALFTVYQRIGALLERDCFYGWLFKIARNEMLQYLRQQQRRIRIAEFEPLTKESEQIRSDDRSALFSNFEDWMAHLEEAEREIIMLRFVDGLSYEELAEALGLPLGTVKWRIFNAKRKLAKIIPVGLAATRMSVQIKVATAQ
jgi:RNA polymerase sigma factor (sigma-70 family)